MPSNPENCLPEIPSDPKPLELFFHTTAEYFGLKVHPPIFQEALERIQGKRCLAGSAVMDCWLRGKTGHVHLPINSPEARMHPAYAPAKYIDKNLAAYGPTG